MFSSRAHANEHLIGIEFDGAHSLIDGTSAERTSLLLVFLLPKGLAFVDTKLIGISVHTGLCLFIGIDYFGGINSLERDIGLGKRGLGLDHRLPLGRHFRRISWSWERCWLGF